MVVSRLQWALLGMLAVLAAAGALYLKGRHDDAAVQKPKVAAAQDRAVVAAAEAQGGRQQAARLDLYVNQREAAQGVASRLAQEAARAPDATSPLDGDRAARLRAADRELCALDPAVCTAH